MPSSTRYAAKVCGSNERQEDYDYGRFAWIADPEGNRIELWQPPRDPQPDPS